MYRLITKHTVEEKIVKRAKQKESVQSTIYSGNALKADVFKASEVHDMLIDDEDEEQLKNKSFIKTKRLKKVPKKPSVTKEASRVEDQATPEKKVKKVKVPKPKKEAPSGNIFAVQKTSGASSGPVRDIFAVSKNVPHK